MALILKADAALAEVEAASVVIVDTETKSLYPWKYGKILAGLGVKALGGTPFYLPLRHPDSKTNAPMKEFKRLAKALRGKRLVMHNAKFDLAVLYQEGFDFSDEDVACTMVMARLCYENEVNYGLEAICSGMAYRKISEHEDAGSVPTVVLDKRAYDQKNALKEALKRIKKEKGFNKIDMVSYDMVPPEEFELYASKDLELEERLYEHCEPIIEERELGELWALERRVTRALFDMEHHGFMLDMEYVKAEHERTTELLDGMAVEMEKLAGRVVDYNSPQAVKKIMGELGVKSELKTDKGNESWSKGALAMSDHPLAELIVMARAIYKIRGSYYEPFDKLSDDENAIHANIAQSGAKTGRMSCREPNLQNIPRFEGFTGARAGAIAEGLKMQKAKAKEKARASQGVEEEVAGEAQATGIEKELFGKVRGSFIPRDGCFLGFFDWSQIELRIFADYAKEKELLEVFDYGLDVHRMTALSAFGTMPEDEDSNEFKWFRNMGKQISFGLIYGMGTRLLAIEIGEGDTEEGKAKAQAFMDAYFARFRNARRFIDRVHQAVYDKGWLKNRWKRRRYIPSDKAYIGVNFLVQGTAADLMKDALDRVWRALKAKGLKAQPLVPIHDEIIVEIPYGEAREVIELVVAEMSWATNLSIPLAVDVEWSDTRWSEKEKLKCKGCDGTGKLLNVGQDDLLQAMYRSDQEFMDKVEVKECPECGGAKLDLTPVESYQANCTHHWILGDPDVEGVCKGVCKKCGVTKDHGGGGTTESIEAVYAYLKSNDGRKIEWRDLKRESRVGSSRLGRIVRKLIENGIIEEPSQYTYKVLKELPKVG